MLILGLSSLFKSDTAAALVRDGVVEAAIENHKLDSSSPRGIPVAAIQYCLSQVGASWSDLDALAIANDPFRGWSRRAFSGRRVSLLAPIATAYQQGKEIRRLGKEWTYLRILRHRLSDPPKLVTLDHHACHAASAFFLSPFDQALILTLDGEGDGIAGMVAVGEGNRIRVQKTIPFTNSIGWIYSRVTDLIGFIPSKEEHKTQWLSLEGEPVYKYVFLRMLRSPGDFLPRV